MRILLLLFFATSFSALLSQKNETVDLKWKIGANEKLRYATVMSDIDTSSFNLDFGDFFESFSDSTQNSINKGKDFFKKFNQVFQKLDYKTTLSSNNEGIVEIIMTSRPKEKTEKNNLDSLETNMLNMMQHMNQGIVLRGSVFETGPIHSFWLRNDQKNLIALLFELPSIPVSIGDKWPLNINLIGNDQNFECDSAYKINEVTLTDVKISEGDSIAILKYNVEEFVVGNLSSPLFRNSENNSKKTIMKFSHNAIAEFSICKGRWLSYDGIMRIETTGFMSTNRKTKFTLQIE